MSRMFGGGVCVDLWSYWSLVVVVVEVVLGGGRRSGRGGDLMVRSVR